MAISEFDLIDRFFARAADRSAPGVVAGIGDDCAVLQLEPGERLATSIDTQVQGRHFMFDTPPVHIGYRAVAAAVSDLAAMGAQPRGMTLALTLPKADESWLQGFSEGLHEASRNFGCPLIGGDLTRGPLTITIAVFGALPPDRMLARSGAQPGDQLWVSGSLGDAAAALRVLAGEWPGPAEEAQYLLRRFYSPSPRLALGQQLLEHGATAAIDVSDGLLADVGHIAHASGVRIVVDSKSLPLSDVLFKFPDIKQALTWALTGGDDYELCFCLPAGAIAPTGCARIGKVVRGSGVECDFAIEESRGFRHF